jgi:hypothetical protein
MPSRPARPRARLPTGEAMKGPAGRLKFDLRRLWECPACGRQERTGGEAVFRLCPCQSNEATPRWMRLVETRPTLSLPAVAPSAAASVSGSGPESQQTQGD